jgi:calcium-dependent protein kinase
MIGEGTYGQVFKAECKATLALRAIKVLKAKYMKEAQVESLLSEMRVLSQLSHPSIISLHDLFHHQKTYYVVMEYCSGGSVVEMIQSIAPKSELIIANIMKQVFLALSYLHSLNVIHRDIKLENIVFLTAAGQADKDCIPIRLIDFGAAVKSQYRVVQNYPVAGTLSYLAPEAIRGVLCDKSDLWSSGVLLHILLTGVPPFKGRDELETKANISSK